MTTQTALSLNFELSEFILVAYRTSFSFEVMIEIGWGGEGASERVSSSIRVTKQHVT